MSFVLGDQPIASPVYWSLAQITPDEFGRNHPKEERGKGGTEPNARQKLWRKQQHKRPGYRENQECRDLES